MEKYAVTFAFLMLATLKAPSAMAVQRDYQFCRKTIESVAKEFEMPFQFQTNSDVLQGYNETLTTGSKTYIRRASPGTQNPAVLSLKLTEKDGIQAEYEIVHKDKCVSARFGRWECRETKLNFEVTVDPVSSKCAFRSMTVKQYGKGIETVHRTLMNTRICDALRGLDQEGLDTFQVSPENEKGKWKSNYGLTMQGGKRSQQTDGIAIKHLQNRCGDWVEGYKNKKGPAVTPSPEATT